MASEQVSGHVRRGRLEQFVDMMATVDGYQAALTISIGFAAHADYTDEALEAIRADAQDLERATLELVRYSRRLASDWRNQRRDLERARQARAAV